MIIPVSEHRKPLLKAMARDCDLQKLKDEIKVHERNIATFEHAVAQERTTIAEYEYMIAVREARET